jgi:hypothetical protein
MVRISQQILMTRKPFSSKVIVALAIVMRTSSKLIHLKVELDTGMFQLIGQVVKFLKKEKMFTLSPDGKWSST